MLLPCIDTCCRKWAYLHPHMAPRVGIKFVVFTQTRRWVPYTGERFEINPKALTCSSISSHCTQIRGNYKRPSSPLCNARKGSIGRSFICFEKDASRWEPDLKRMLCLPSPRSLRYPECCFFSSRTFRFEGFYPSSCASARPSFFFSSAP